jgi:hypothetical protein
VSGAAAAVASMPQEDAGQEPPSSSPKHAVFPPSRFSSRASRPRAAPCGCPVRRDGQPARICEYGTTAEDALRLLFRHGCVLPAGAPSPAPSFCPRRTWFPCSICLSLCSVSLSLLRLGLFFLFSYKAAQARPLAAHGAVSNARAVRLRGEFGFRWHLSRQAGWAAPHGPRAGRHRPRS